MLVDSFVEVKRSASLKLMQLYVIHVETSKQFCADTLIFILREEDLKLFSLYVYVKTSYL